jgi:Uncharacterized alpha/beta hydrolase domain (DUF2235)
MRNIIICCDGTGNEISENISNVLKFYRCLRKTEKTQPQKQQGWPRVERRDLFRICQTLPISDAEKIAGLLAEMPARQFVKFYRLSARSWNLAYAAPSPACAAAADPAATAATHSAPTAAPASTATTATPANNNDGKLHVAAGGFLIEEMERGETDVGHFLFAKNEALIGRDAVRLRDITIGYRGCGCAPRQRETQSGRTECRYGGGLGRARVLRSLLHPWHVASFRKLLVVVKGST